MEILRKVNLKRCGFSILGSLILAFGLYHVHAICPITEGGVLGLTLFFQHWFRISPAWSGLILNALCYLIGWRSFGKGFLVYSAISCGCFSIFYGLLEQTPHLWPDLVNRPLLAAVVGALFVGVGCGLCVRVCSAPSGDDALALSIAKRFRCSIQLAYLVTDLIVLGLSLSYIPAKQIAYSLITVLLSGQIIGLVERIPLPSNHRKQST